MAPAPAAVKPVGAKDGSKSKPPEKRFASSSDLQCRVKYCNTLPDLPFDPKFLKYPFDENRFIAYKPTSLEREFKYDFLTEHDLELGKNLDFLILPEPYSQAHSNEKLMEEDEKLLEEDPTNMQDSKRSQQHVKKISWLRKTEYISTEYNRFVPTNKKTETSVGIRLQNDFKGEVQYKDKLSQIAAIEKTFESAKIPIEKHYSKPGVVPIQVCPVLPDFQMWKFPCAQVIFDSDPCRKVLQGNVPNANAAEELSHAMIRGMSDEMGEQFVAYFLPTPATLTKKKQLQQDGLTEKAVQDEYEYELVREYSWNVKNKASHGYEEDYFFVFTDEAVAYNELETRVRLSKRKRKTGQQTRTLLSTRFRPFTEQELKVQRVRLAQLDIAPDEDDEADEEQEPSAPEDSSDHEARHASPTAPSSPPDLAT